MPRSLRLEHPGARHHIYNRVKNREPLLDSVFARRVMRREIALLPKEFGVVVHGFAFMPNHFHLMVESRQGRLPEAMQAFMSRSVRQINERFGWDGALFRARYNNRVVEKEAYWRHLLAYLHLNPVRAGLAPNAFGATTTSHRAYLGIERVPWLETSELLELFGGRDTLARYIDDVAAGHRGAPEGFDPKALGGPPDTYAAPSSTFERRDLAEATRQVRAITGLGAGWMRDPDVKDLAIWWAVMGGTSRARVGREIGMSAQAVGRHVRRIEETTDVPLAGWRDALIASLT